MPLYAAWGGACFAGAARSWWGPDRGPLGLRPLARGVFFRVPRESSSSDVLTRTSGRRGAHPPTGAVTLDAPSRAPIRPLPDAFHRRMPARPDACAPNLERGPATEPRFCHPGPGFQRSFAPSPREGEGARPSRFSESSSLRCVRGHASFVDFCQRDDPQARPSDDRHPASYAGSDAAFASSSPARGPVRGGFLSHPRLTGAARGPRSRGLSGQGPFDVDSRSRALRQAPSSRDGSRWRLRPNPMWLGHLVSRCRSPPGWSRRGVARCAAIPPIFRGFAPPARLRGRSRGPPPAPLREKKMRSAAPEVPSVQRSPFREGSIHRLSPTCGG